MYLAPQYNDNVVGPGSPRYDNAYFEIDYVRAYTTGAPAPSGTAMSDSVAEHTSSVTSTRGVSGTRGLQACRWLFFGIAIGAWIGWTY
jgi:hypothetical protein